MIGSARMDDIEAGVRLGGFTLERRIGEGGMAEVWLGHHSNEGLPAAIKVITRQRADDESYREGLRREVRAVAALDHPHIVPVFDAGTVDAASAAASGGALVAGSPWLAMLYAEHGELRRLPSPMAWPLLREVLLQILDGLAHAHARGVIHRDLKPENVLLHIESDRLRLMLTDFGIAHVIDAQQSDGGASANSAGTPHYMAPEQFMGRWRDYGPWTDLYALGCMAFELATGHPPFTDRTLFGIAQKHLTEPIPPLISPHPMPVGFEKWVRRMMQRAPHDRFQSAADAAWALGRLAVPSDAVTRAARLDALERLGAAEPGQVTEISSPHGVAHAETRDLSEAFEPGFTLACVIDPEGLVAGQPCAVPDPEPETAFDGPAPHDLPPMPQTWFVDMPERPLLKGVGLGLFGVRALPFVDRDQQRDVLWRALRDVRRHGHSRLVVLEGLEGSGKSRLGQWFTQRASEVGAAEPIHVRHSAMDAPGDALAAAVEGWFRGQDLDQQRLEERIAQRLTSLDPERAQRIADVDAPALARFVRPDGDERLQAHQQTPRERYGAVHAWVHALARQRPVILLLDDVQWCEDSLALVEWMLDSAPEPVLIVATLRADLCCEGTPEAVVVERLEASARSERVTVGPLADADHGRVIRDLLGLHPYLADQLLERSEGNPLFAIQIVTDWIERRALESTAQGYMCNGTALVDVPPDLPTLAGRRFERLAQRFPAPDAVQVALQTAAALGHAVQVDEWHAALAGIGDGVTVPEGLLDALYDAGLAVPARDGWVFGHGFARDALMQQAAADGRWKMINRACAAAVREGRAPDERRARHLMKAGDDQATIDALLEAAQNRMDASEYSRALSLCSWRACVVDGMDLPADDVRRIAALPIEVEALRFLGRSDEATETLTRFRRFPFGHEHPRLLAEAERLRGGQAFASGAVEVMSEAYRQAIDLYKVADDPRGEARARHGMGWSLMYLGRSAAAERAFIASHAVAARAGLRIDEGWALQGIGAARAFGLRGDGRAPLLAAREIFRETRLPAGMLGCRIFLAEVERQAGDLKAAQTMAASAVDIGRTIGSHIAYFGQALLASISLDLGDLAEAQRLIAEMRAAGAIERVERVHRQFAPSVRVVLARVALAHGRVDEARESLIEIEAVRIRTFLQPASCAALMQLGQACEERGLLTDAARWWRLAADYYARISPERSAHSLARLKAISG